jgi:hypothetical protein
VPRARRGSGYATSETFVITLYRYQKLIPRNPVLELRAGGHGFNKVLPSAVNTWRLSYPAVVATPGMTTGWDVMLIGPDACGAHRHPPPFYFRDFRGVPALLRVALGCELRNVGKDDSSPKATNTHVVYKVITNRTNR